MLSARSEISPERRSGRIRLMAVLFLFLFAVSFALLFRIQVTGHEYYSFLANSQHVKSIEVEPLRGNIYDRNGSLLAGNTAVVTFEVYWPNVSNDDQSRRIDTLVTRLGEHARVFLPLQSCTGNMILAADVPYAEASEIKQHLPDVVDITIGQRRTYPYEDIMAGVVGRHSEEFSEGFEAWDDDELQGTGGIMFIEKSALQEWNLPNLDADNIPAVNGQDVMLTLDARFQSIVIDELDSMLEESGGLWAACVIVDPNSGEVLAAGSVPVRAPNGALAINHCFNGSQEPGSTFKIVTYAACIEEGVFSEEMLFDCSEGHIIVSGERISDAHKLDTLTREEVIIHSSNVGTVMFGNLLDSGTLVSYCRNFGFGLPTCIQYPGESNGVLSSPGSSGWSGVSKAQLAIGQEINVTPIQLAMAFSVIANGGTLYYPRLIAAGKEDGRWLFSNPIIRNRVVSQETADEVLNTLTSVVIEGTGMSASVNGVSVAGKTGTAERMHDEYDYLSVFAGMIPADNPKLVAVVMIADPDYAYRWGSASAAPAFSRIMTRIVSIEPDIVLDPLSISADLLPAGGVI